MHIYSVGRPWWRHQMVSIFHLTGPLWEEFSGRRGISLTKDSGAAELWCFFICGWTYGWISNRDAGDMRRHHAHYDATVMQDPHFLGYYHFRNHHKCKLAISMVWCKTVVTPLLTQWSYYSLALGHRHHLYIASFRPITFSSPSFPHKMTSRKLVV